jgi:four helix bundle protein
MSNQPNTKYDLEERTAKFGEDIIELCKQLPVNHITRSLIDQLIRSATSIGANYMEAINGSSKRDFRNKIYISKKECQETMHWLRMLAKAIPEKQVIFRVLWKEAHELTLIFQTIGSSTVI